MAAGANGSGTRILALELLKLNGVSEQSTEILAMGGEQAAGQLQRGEIEAAFFVAAYHSPFVQQLFRTPNVGLMSFERAEAYTMNLHYLSRVKLARGAIDFELDIPGFVRLRYRGLDNKEATPTIAGDYAALLAHETHCLNGVFYVDYV